MNSPDGLIRKAGFVMFGTIIEGCADAIRSVDKHLSCLLDSIVTLV